MSVREAVAGASSSGLVSGYVSTTDGADRMVYVKPHGVILVYAGTTYGVQLLIQWARRNWTHPLVYRSYCFVPKFCITKSITLFMFFVHWGKL